MATTPESGCAEGFVERLARLLEEDGGPRIAGRMMGLCLLTPDAMTLEEMADRLRVSKASVSTNARLLEHAGMLERTSRPGDRRDFYRVRDDAFAHLVARKVAWFRALGEAVDEGARTPEAVHPDVRRRLRDFRAAQQEAVRLGEELLGRLRALDDEDVEEGGR